MKREYNHLATLLSAGLATSLTAGTVAAAENPFLAKDLAQHGTNLLAEASTAQTDMKAGAAGEKMKGAAEMKCGANMMKKDATAADPKAAADAAKGMKMDGAPVPPPSAPTPAK